MAEYVTKEDVKDIVVEVVNKAVDDLSDVISSFASQVYRRFNDVEAGMDKLDKSHDKLLSTIDSFLRRLDEIETGQLARDRQLEKLLAWARKVSEKPEYH